MQGDDGYPNDQILLHEALAVLTFTNDTRLMQNIPCAYVWTPSDTSNRQKIGSNIYKFPYRPQKFVGCAGGPGDLFAVCGRLLSYAHSFAQGLCALSRDEQTGAGQKMCALTGRKQTQEMCAI